jgi:hypothetical protein
MSKPCHEVALYYAETEKSAKVLRIPVYSSLSYTFLHRISIVTILGTVLI